MESQKNKQRIMFPVAGFIYGLLLAIIGFAATAAGHGTYVLIGISSAPLGFLEIIVALLSPPLLWSIIGWLLGKSEQQRNRNVFLVMMAFHYLSLWPLLTREPYGDWEYFNRAWSYSPGIITTGIGSYLAGQALIWMYFLWQQYESRRNKSVDVRAA
jgi:hypothetical protein